MENRAMVYIATVSRGTERQFHYTILTGSCNLHVTIRLLGWRQVGVNRCQSGPVGAGRLDMLGRADLRNRTCSESGLVFAPCHARDVGWNLFHRNAAGNGTDETAQVAANTRVLFDFVSVGIVSAQAGQDLLPTAQLDLVSAATLCVCRERLSINRDLENRLVRTVLARDVAQSAVDTLLLINIDDSVITLDHGLGRTDGHAKRILAMITGTETKLGPGNTTYCF